MAPMNPRLLRPTGQFDPRRVAGLSAWWDPTDESKITTGTGVSAWVDKSPNAYTLSQGTGANQPTKSTLNGRQVFSYNGTTQLLSSTTAGLVSLGTATTAVNPTTIFYVARTNQTAIQIPAAWGSSSSNNPIYSALHTMNTGKWRTFYRDNTTAPGLEITTESSASYATSTTYVVSTQTGSSIVGRVNGQEVVAVSNTLQSLALTPTLFAVGALLRSTAALYFSGVIGDVLIYNRVLSAAENSAVERWLASRWGVTL
jgi:hypothetical protein